MGSEDHLQQWRSNFEGIDNASNKVLHLWPIDMKSSKKKEVSPICHVLDLSSHKDLLPDRYFYGSCPISLKYGTEGSELKACSGCMSVCYAGREEQKADWKRHKPICKVLQKLVKNGGQHPLSKEPDLQGKYQKLLSQALNRNLTQFESDLLVYPRLCAVCLDGRQGQLQTCQLCHSVAYCSPECKKEDSKLHSLSCKLLLTAIEHHRQLQIMKIQAVKDNSYSKILSLESLYKPMVKSRYERLPPNIDDVFDEDVDLMASTALAGIPDLNQVKSYIQRQLTYRYTCQLTALYAAETAGLSGGRKVDTCESLTLHIVGAREAEVKDVSFWEIWGLRLPNLKHLNVVFIGPELNCPFKSKDFYSQSKYLEKVRPDLKIRYTFVHNTYDGYMDVACKVKPDLVAAFNCGFIFYTSWDPSLPSMIKYADVPLVFTEYYHEDCGLNLQKVDSLVDDELEVVLEPARNPFCSSLPARIPTGFAFRKFKRSNVVMSNDFICIVKSTLE